ncbi:MAG: hypothetical protein HY352_05880 [Candidatus Omnitrophica bacterium]|nr:hypothetical protein [Candidatus Omnitrophota bacterium]
MKTWRMWGIVSVMVVAGAAWAEDVTITTYYPSPRGVFDDIQFRKGEDYDNTVFKVDPDQTSKLNILDVTTINNLGNLKITGSVYVQSQPTVPAFPYGLGLKVVNATTTLAGSAVIDKSTNAAATQALKVTGSGAGATAADIGAGLTKITGAATVDKTTNASATEVLKVTGSGGGTVALKVIGSGAGQTAADIGAGLTKITGAATVDKTTNATATEVLKVTGGGAASTGLLVTNGETKLEQKTTVGPTTGSTNLMLEVYGKSNLKDLTTIGPLNNSSLVLDVNGKSAFHDDVTLDKKLVLNGNPTSLEATNDVLIHGKLKVDGDTQLNARLKVVGDTELGKLTVTGDAHFKNLTVEDYVNLVGPSTSLSTSIQTIGSIVAQGNVTAKQFIDLDDPTFLVDPFGDSKLNNLEITGNFTVNDLDVKGKIWNSTPNTPVKVDDDLLVTGTSDFRGAIGNNGGASPLVVSSTINLVQGHDLVATDGSSTSFVGGGGGHLGIGTISGGAYAGAECSGVLCHLQVGGGGGSVDFDSAGGVNFTATGGSATFDTGSTLNIINGNFTAGDPGTTAAANAKVLAQNGSKAEWQTLPAASATLTFSNCYTILPSCNGTLSCAGGEVVTAVTWSNPSTCSGDNNNHKVGVTCCLLTLSP